MPLLSAGRETITPLPTLLVAVLDPGITTGALRAKRLSDGAWWLQDTHAWDDAQLMLNIHGFLASSDKVIIERLPKTLEPQLAAITKDIVTACVRMRVTDIINVAPGTWKPWIRQRGLPLSWLRMQGKLRTPHERDCLRMLCWWAATNGHLGVDEWKQK